VAVGGGAAAGDEGAGAGAGGAVTCTGFTFRGRSDVLQVPLPPCRDTRTVIMTRTPGVASPTRNRTVRRPEASARPRARSPFARARGPVAATRARATVLTVIVTVVRSRGRLLLARAWHAGGTATVAGTTAGVGERVGVGVGAAAAWLVGVDGGLTTDPIMTSRTKIAKTAIMADQMGWRRGHARFLGGLAC
jgi:hypothetical protein